MITEKMLNNANKVAFLVKQYPEHNLNQIISLLTMPSVEINTAIWAAVELGFITELDKKTQRIALSEKAPQTWQFGREVDDLMAMIEYAFIKLAVQEQDLEETYVSNWTGGYPAHDVMVALAFMVDHKILATYQLTDPKDTKSTYTFYSLFENGEQMWGRKQFDEEPTGEEVPDTSDEQPVPGRSEAHEEARIRGDESRAEANDTTTTTTIDPSQTSLI